MSLATVRSDIADEITAGCAGWRCLDYIPDQINPPQMTVDFEVGEQLTFGAVGSTGHDYEFVVRAFAQRDSERAGQLKLDVLRDPTDAASLWQVLEDSAVGDFVRVTTASAVQVATIGAVDYLMVEFQLKAVI